MHFLLTPGQRNELPVAWALVNGGGVQHYGRRQWRAQRIICDKGYTSKAFRAALHAAGFRYTIPRLRHERYRGRFDKALYRQRNVIERTFNRLKQFRRLATRFDKRAANFAAFLVLAFILLWG
jgi:transposase